MMQCHRPTGNSVCGKMIIVRRDSGKIKVQKHPENVMKNK